MTELSPAAQAIWAAFKEAPMCAENKLAAALRAVADLPSASAPVPFRYRLLELAAELEGVQ